MAIDTLTESLDTYRVESPDTYQVKSLDTYRVESSDTYRVESPDTYQVESPDTYRVFVIVLPISGSCLFLFVIKSLFQRSSVLLL